jgi:hypothetical protein
MTTFGHRVLFKLNEWWHEEGDNGQSVCFIEDNGTIVVQTNHRYVGIVYWISTDILVISMQPTYEHHQSVQLFLMRTLSAFLHNVAIRCPAVTYNYAANQ